MSGPRWAAAVLFAGGLAAGSLAPGAAPREPARAGEYWMLAVDFHVHGFPGDGALPPWLLRDEAARSGLDAFVLTNHNRVSTARAARWMIDRTPGPFVIVGQEITAGGFHIAAAGIEQRVDWRSGAASAIRAVHAQGGVAIAAHPSRAYTGGLSDAAVAVLDGYERAHPSMQTPPAGADFAAFGERAERLRPGIAAIGSSDYHVASGPGFCRTWVLARERTASGVVDAVRNGRTVAMDMDGRLYGPADAVRLMRDAHPTVPAVRHPDAWSRAAAAAAAAGLLFLVLL